MNKWLSNILALIIFAFLLWYLSGYWEQLKVMLNLRPELLVTMYFLYFLSFLVSAFVDKYLLKALDTPAAFWDIFRLDNAASLLNYVPMKFGTLFRANYLKRHYGLAYPHFATFFFYTIFLMTALAAVVGLGVLLTVYGAAGYESRILAAVFVGTIAASLLFLFTPLPVPKAAGQFSSMLRNFLSGRAQIARQTKTNIVAAVLLSANFLITALRIGIIYHSIGKSIHPAGYLILGALGFVVLFIGLTPGALGIRELVLGFGAVVLAVPLEVGLLAAMIDRAITISYTFVVGGCCTVWLWRKSPTDFKQQKVNSSPRVSDHIG
ncbi:MAG: flippase-like domain-containing protein [Sedimentisphaerales bacterium]|jgi:uncharacterized membrane protein YbhN (UPF0104 family)|nr:flippase-like domain-containing protein [Sedimentisphaerales bacterium]